MRAELLAYRANPSDARFSALYRAAHPWLRSTGISTVRRYSNLTVSGALDDVVNEGALALSVSARRFSYFCGECERVFLHARDLSAHSAREHRRRGSAGAVSLDTFARTSARLAMRRTARRLYRPETPTDWIEDVAFDEDSEERMILEIMISRLRDRISAGARAAFEALLRAATGEELEDEAERFILAMSRVNGTAKKERKMPEYTPEPRWTELNIRTLRESARSVLSLETSRRTMKSAYADLYEQLQASDRKLDFTCEKCQSVIDEKMQNCWACGAIFRDGPEEEEIADAELLSRARKFGISDAKGMSRADLLARIEETETKTRAARRNVDLLTIESAKINEGLTEKMPDGWSKKVLLQYTAYVDPGLTRRILIYNRGLKVQFSVDDGFLDGFPDLTFFSAEQRRTMHMGRVNYEYSGDTAKYVLDLCVRVMRKYTGA